MKGCKMTIFRYKGNGLLYTITADFGVHLRVHPYLHEVEIGVKYKHRFREFKYNMKLSDFEVVAQK